MTPSQYTIRTMTRDDLDQVLDWAAAEGWNPGLQDGDCFYEADPQGFLLGVLEDTPIAALSVVKYGKSFGFLGFYIVRPDFRGQGYGLRLWQVGLETLKGRTIGLDGVVAQQSNYLKSGFKLAYRNIRYQGISDGNSLSDPTPALIPLAQLPVKPVVEYDQPFFPDDRATFLQRWITHPNHWSIGIRVDDQLAGYGVVRPCRTGYKIGPLFADTPELAETLFLALKAQVPAGQPFYLDVPEVNPAAIALAERYQMDSMFETARMYAPEIPQLPTARIFGVTTFELG